MHILKTVKNLWNGLEKILVIYGGNNEKHIIYFYEK